MASRVERIGDATLYLGDCREILPTLGQVDALVTDPPYGIGADKNAAKNKGKAGWKFYGQTDWDASRPPDSLLRLILSFGAVQIVWGGNYFTDILPPTMRWLIWDKGQRDFSLADFEMAWCSQQKAARIFQYSRAKALRDGKQHPTQKPVAVMEWCLQLIPPGLVLDPFMGSGTTGVAAVNVGRPFVGIEISEEYFDISCSRIRDAYSRPKLFQDLPPAPEQERMEF